MQRPEARRQQLILKLTCCHHDWSLLHWDKQMRCLKKAEINSAFSGCKVGEMIIFHEVIWLNSSALEKKREREAGNIQTIVRFSYLWVEYHLDMLKRTQQQLTFIHFLWGQLGWRISRKTLVWWQPEVTQQTLLKRFFILPTANHRYFSSNASAFKLFQG